MSFSVTPSPYGYGPPGGHGYPGQPRYVGQPGYDGHSGYGGHPGYGPAGMYPGYPGAVAPGHVLPFPLANRGKRLLARIIDTIVFTIALLAICVPLALYVDRHYPDETGVVPTAAGYTILVLFLFGPFLYEAPQLARWGKTVGKAITGLRVVRSSPPGAPLSAGRAFGRTACYPLLASIPGIALFGLLSVLWQFWDEPYHQCLHDKMAGTVVIAHR